MPLFIGSTNLTFVSENSCRIKLFAVILLKCFVKVLISVCTEVGCQGGYKVSQGGDISGGGLQNNLQGLDQSSLDPDPCDPTCPASLL